MVLGEVVTAIGGYGLELMVGEERAQLSSGGTVGAMEFVVGIFHLIHLEYCLQASFVEGGVVGYHIKCFTEWVYTVSLVQ